MILGAGGTGTAVGVTLSRGTASAEHDSIELRFSGDLDVTSASAPATYKVQVNGTAVTVHSVALRGHNRVVLGLPTGSMNRDDPVVVLWPSLLDAHGNPVTGNAML